MTNEVKSPTHGALLAPSNQAATAQNETPPVRHGAAIWYHKDTDGELQGPHTSSEIIAMIVGGEFDGKGSISFSTSPKGDFKPLSRQLEHILEYNCMEVADRLKLAQAKEQPASLPSDDNLTAVLEMPADLDIVTSDTTKALYKSLRTSDMDIIITSNATDGRQDQSGSPEENGDGDEANTLGWWEQNPSRATGVESDDKNPSPVSIRSQYSSICLCVHSSLLKIASPVFMEELYAVEQKWKRSLKTDENARKRYEIQSACPEAIRLIIRYAYGYSIEAESADPLLLVSVIKEAHRLSMPRLIDKCIETLSKPRSIEAMVALATAAEILDLDTLLREVVYDLANCSFALFSDMSYLQLGPTAFQMLLRSNTIQLDEIQIFHCTFLWLLEHPSTRLPSPGASQTPEVVVRNRRRLLMKPKSGWDDKRVQWQPPRTKKEQCAMSVKLLEGIRFCSMSPGQMHSIRLPYLDSLLLEAMMRKSFSEERPTRVFPWKGNNDFAIKCYGGLFPVTLCRRRSGEIGIKDCWAWTTGHVRWISEAVWAIEVVSCDCNQLNIGLVMEQSNEKALQASKGLKMGHKNMAFYFSCGDRSFNTGIIDSDPRVVTYRMRHTPLQTNDWRQTLTKGDVIFIRVTTARSSLHLSVETLNRKHMLAQHVFNHSDNPTKQGKFSRRYGIRLAPFLECYSQTDIYGVPELQSNIPGAVYN